MKHHPEGEQKKLTRKTMSCLLKRLKSAFNSQYIKGFQKLLLKAVQVTRKSRNGGNWK